MKHACLRLSIPEIVRANVVQCHPMQLRESGSLKPSLRQALRCT